jgi:hypothetical protein
MPVSDPLTEDTQNINHKIIGWGRSDTTTLPLIRNLKPEEEAVKVQLTGKCTGMGWAA